VCRLARTVVVMSACGVMVEPRPRIMSRRLALFFGAMLGGASSFYLLLSVVPLYATAGGAGGVGAGLTTGALMLATVAAELVAPRLIARYGYRATLAAGLVLLGAPAIVFAYASSLPAIVAVCLVRGLGFAVTVVCGSALVAALVPAERRGEGLGLYGIVIGVSSIVALPLGIALAGRYGFPPVFWAGALAALAGAAIVAALPLGAPPAEQSVGVLAGLRTPRLLRPSVVFSATAMAAGVLVTFLPLAVTRASGGLAAAALLFQAVTSTLFRWWAGRYGDRRGPARLLIPSVVASGAGMLALVWIDHPAAVMGGMALFGAGFGVAQNASIAMMFDRVAPSGYGTVSAVWNLAYDAGLGIGAAVFGVVATQTGYPIAFLLTGVVVLAALGPAIRDRVAA